MIWTAVIAGSLACYLLKLAGFTLPDRVLTAPAMQRVTALIPVAFLAALVGVQTFAQGASVTVDARIAGLAAAVVALLLRAPFLLVVIVAAAVAAGTRALGLLP
jgi:branched-subunit amino acid transport protein